MGNSRNNKNSIGLIIKLLKNDADRQFETLARKNGMDDLTSNHGRILGYLYSNMDKDIFQKDIEQEFNISRATVSNLVQLVEKKGYIRREAISEDARLKKLVLTEKGIDSHKKALKTINEFEQALTFNLSEEEIKEFIRLIGKIRQGLIDNPNNEGKE